MRHNSKIWTEWKNSGGKGNMQSERTLIRIFRVNFFRLSIVTIFFHRSKFFNAFRIFFQTRVFFSIKFADKKKPIAPLPSPPQLLKSNKWTIPMVRCKRVPIFLAKLWDYIPANILNFKIFDNEIDYNVKIEFND